MVVVAVVVVVVLVVATALVGAGGLVVIAAVVVAAVVDIVAVVTTVDVAVTDEDVPVATVGSVNPDGAASASAAATPVANTSGTPKAAISLRESRQRMGIKTARLKS